MSVVKIAFCAANALLGICVSASEPSFVWPESGTATIPKGTTVVVTDADYDKVNALQSITIEEGATNIFTTAKAPTMQIKGYGAWIKRGAAVWNLTEPQTNFYGSFILEEGVVTNCIAYGKGYDWTYDKELSS